MAEDARYEAIVVGVGGHGSAALYHLAKRGVKVLGIEQFDLGHDKGSSHGLTRIIRLAYWWFNEKEDAGYMPLLRRSYQLWRQLESETGLELMTITGGLDISVGLGGSSGMNAFTGALLAAQTHGLAHEVLTGAQVNERWPGYHLPPDCQALYQPDGGLLAPERCIRAHVAAARMHGAELHANERVLRWSVIADDGRVEVVTDRGVYRAGRLVLSAGAWMPQLLPSLQEVWQVERQTIAWFQPSQPEAFMPSSFPIFILDDPTGMFYGFPSYDHPGFKIGKMNHRHDTTTADGLDRHVSAAEQQVLRAGVAQYFPLANGAMMKASACMYTNSPDHHFILGQHPEHKEVIICSACSGHGFKFASVIGEIVADLVQKGSTAHDLHAHSVSRLPGLLHLNSKL